MSLRPVPRFGSVAHSESAFRDDRSVKHPLAAYILLVYAASIGLSVIVWLTGGDQSPLAFAFGAAAMFVPALATLVVVVFMDAPPPTLRWSHLPLGI